MAQRVWVRVLGICVALLLGWSACAVEPVGASAAGPRALARATGINARALRPPCRSANVVLGRRPRDVRFIVHCVTRHGHRFAVTLNRSRPGGGAARIDAYNRRPRTRGPGAVSRHGSCEETRYGLICEARARGLVTLIGDVRVPAGSRCRARFTLTQVVPQSCQLKPDGACPESLEIAEFFDGRPQGC